MWQSIRIILVFAFVGPPIVGLIVCPLMLCFVNFYDGDGGLSGLMGGLPSCAMEGPVLGYVAGFVPAAFAGTVLAILFPSADRRHLGWATALSMAIALLVGGLLTYDHALPVDDQPEAVAFAGATAVAGLIAGHLCWRILYPRRLLSPGA